MRHWPFEDPQNVAVFTVRSILDGDDWIYYVTHDEEDGAWQFTPPCGANAGARCQGCCSQNSDDPGSFDR